MNLYEKPVNSAADVQGIIDEMRAYFETGETLSVDFRIRQLKRLGAYLREHEQDALDALHADLGKSAFESYATELGLVYDEIRTCVKHARAWARPKCVCTPLMNFPATSKVYPYPFGVAAVLSPWNYPIQLALVPLVDAIVAGNCVIMKPSKTSVHTSEFIRTMCEEVFDSHFVFCLHGSDEMNDWLLEVNFDKIMFTGSPRVGKLIMKHAADSLTSVTLELGGKSPLFIDKAANIRRAAERVTWGKCLNSGQTCVAPDYALVHESVADEFVKWMGHYLHKFYGDDILASPDYPHMINQKHFDEVCGLIDKRTPGCEIALGGGRNAATLQIEPTLLTGVTLDDPVMGQEIFGPVLPIITWNNVDEAIDVTRTFGHPLACYIFSNDKTFQKAILDRVPSGGAVINDVVIHVANNNMGFGGLQNSGIGAYHGKVGFDCFTHYKSTSKKTTLFDIPVRNPPFNKMSMRILRLLVPPPR